MRSVFVALLTSLHMLLMRPALGSAVLLAGGFMRSILVALLPRLHMLLVGPALRTAMLLAGGFMRSVLVALLTGLDMLLVCAALGMTIIAHVEPSLIFYVTGCMLAPGACNFKVVKMVPAPPVPLQRMRLKNRSLCLF